MDVGTVHQVDIDQEMRAAYLDYAMSVIIARALPDARDGLKPVHRRILYAMYDMGLRPDSPYRKSARIVGEVLGKYHPHGDAAVYDAMVRMAQDFAMRYPLVDGQGNFGSIDGDAAAAMRYTEARIATTGTELLSDIDKNTVDFAENFDGSLTEPVVLPASLPNLIVNGSSGIAVGMSTSIPPHNMGEVCDALTFMLDRWENLDTVTLPDLMRFIKGPDFPTGGLVFRYSDGPETRLKANILVNGRGQKRIVLLDLPAPVDRELMVRQIRQTVDSLGIRGIQEVRDDSNEDERRVTVELDRAADAEAILELLYNGASAMRTHLVDNLAHAYATGRGKVVVQAKAHVEALDRNRNRIIVTELPYQVNKTALIERIAELARDQRIEGLTDLRDESDRQGLRIVIDLTRTVDPYDVLSHLYKLTPMRQTFSIIMLALVDDEPRLLSLKAALRVYLDHRLTVVRRRSEYELERARERAHILEGYLIALDNLDEVIDTIRRSRTVETAHENLRKRFKMTDQQAEAVLAMPLRRLAALERRKIEEEYKGKRALITDLEELLASPAKMRDRIKLELSDLKKLYRDPRRTVIVEGIAGDAVTLAELVPDEQVWITLTERGILSRTFTDQAPKVTQDVKDPPRLMLPAGVSEILYLFTADGVAATVPVHQIPQSNDIENGAPYTSIAPLSADQVVVAALTRGPAATDGYVFLATIGGMVKRIELADLPGLSARSFRVMGLTDDTLRWVEWTTGANEIMLLSAEGKAIRFPEEEVRPMGLPAGGVAGMKLGSQADSVVSMLTVQPGAAVWVITSNGLAKWSPVEDFPLQGRYGQGVIAVKLSEKSGYVAAGVMGMPDDPVIIVTSRSKHRSMRLGAAPRQVRNAPGVGAMPLGPNEHVSGVVAPSSRLAPAFLSGSAAGDLPATAVGTQTASEDG